MIKNLEDNGIGVEKITETSRSIGLELTQFIHPDLNIVEEIIAEATKNSGINKTIKKDIEIANLKAVSEIDESLKETLEQYMKGKLLIELIPPRCEV